MKEFPLLSMFNIHENLLESLLELQNYADVQAVLAKYDGERGDRDARHVSIQSCQPPPPPPPHHSHYHLSLCPVVMLTNRPLLFVHVCFVSPPQILAYPNLQQYATQQPCSKPGRYRTSEYRFSSATKLRLGAPNTCVLLHSFKIELKPPGATSQRTKERG